MNIQNFNIHHYLIANIVRINFHTANSWWLKKTMKKSSKGFLVEHTISPRSSFSNEKSAKAGDVPRIIGIIKSRKIVLSRYLFAYGHACLIIRFIHSARSTSGKKTYNNLDKYSKK
jgi:hypothetical protein